MFETVIVKFIQLSIDIASLQVSDCDLAQIMFLVVHHRDHLLDRSRHVEVKLFEDLQAELWILYQKIKSEGLDLIENVKIKMLLQSIG